jgi:hypothetical protein
MSSCSTLGSRAQFEVYRAILGMLNDGDVAHRKFDGRFTRRSQSFCTTGELSEFWDIDGRPIEELY